MKSFIEFTEEVTPHPEVIKAYKKTLEAEDAVGNQSYKVTKAAVTRASNNLSKMIKKHHGELDSQSNIALRTKLQKMENQNE